jgi:predicted PurR-regulated permease PerM
VDEDPAADGDLSAAAGPGNGERPGADGDHSVAADLAALRAGGDGVPTERTVVDVDTWSFVALAVAALGAAAVFAIVSMAADVLTGIGVGVVVGVALAPVVSAVQRRADMTRGSAVVLVGTGLALAIAAVVLLVAPAAVRQAQDFSDELPQTVRDLYSWPIVGDRLQKADAATQVEEWIKDAPAKVDDATLSNLGERLLGGVLTAVVVLVTALGVMVDGEIVVQRFRSLVPPARRPQADRLGRIVYATFGSYFAGSLFVAVLAGLVTLSVGLLLGVPLSPVAGLWTTLTNLIPQIGGLLGGGFFVLLALTQGPLTAVLALAFVAAYQNLENHVISPAIVGRAVNLSPPATMLAALVGGAAAGVPGALVATPLLGAVKAIYLDSRGQMPEIETEKVRHRLSRVLHRHLDRDAPAGDGDPTVAEGDEPAEPQPDAALTEGKADSASSEDEPDAGATVDDAATGPSG